MARSVTTSAETFKDAIESLGQNLKEKATAREKERLDPIVSILNYQNLDDEALLEAILNASIRERCPEALWKEKARVVRKKSVRTLRGMIDSATFKIPGKANAAIADNDFKIYLRLSRVAVRDRND